jgi:hypothetical protein
MQCQCQCQFSCGLKKKGEVEVDVEVGDAAAVSVKGGRVTGSGWPDWTRAVQCWWCQLGGCRGGWSCHLGAIACLIIVAKVALSVFA